MGREWAEMPKTRDRTPRPKKRQKKKVSFLSPWSIKIDTLRTLTYTLQSKTHYNNSSAMKLVLLSTLALTANAFSPPVSPPVFSSTSNHPSRTHTTLAEDFGLFKGTSLGFDDIWGDNEVRGNRH
jgi:hypothetical protein